jgi:hypothetical protein
MVQVDFSLPLAENVRTSDGRSGKAELTLGKIALSRLSRSSTYGEALSNRSLIAKVKAGGVQSLEDSEFKVLYGVLRFLSTENKIKLALNLADNGFDIVGYESAAAIEN